MAVGKHLSLEEARRLKLLDRFAKEHPSEGDEAAFDRLLEAMVDSPEEKSGDRSEPGRRKLPSGD